MQFQQSLSHNNFYYLKWLVKNLFLPFQLIFKRTKGSINCIYRTRIPSAFIFVMTIHCMGSHALMKSKILQIKQN